MDSKFGFIIILIAIGVFIYRVLFSLGQGLRPYIKRIYRLYLNPAKAEESVWKDLKKMFAKEEWHHGVYEKQKYIEAFFEVSKDKVESFFYMINGGCFSCRVKLLDNFPIELTTEFFILAAHFNNLLQNGVVRVNTQSRYVEYCIKKDTVIPLLYAGELYRQLMQHYQTSKDVYWAFQRLVEENEAPAIIIADLLKKIDDEEKETQTPSDDKD